MARLERLIAQIDGYRRDRDRKAIVPAIRSLTRKTLRKPEFQESFLKDLQILKIDWLWGVGLFYEALEYAFADPITGRRIESDAGLRELPAEQLSWIARLLASIGVWPYALRIMAVASSGSSRARMNEAMTLFQIGRFRDAYDRFDWLRRDPSEERRWVVIQGFAHSCMHVGIWDLAIRYYERGLEVAKSPADRWGLACMRAIARVMIGDKEAGLVELEVAEAGLPNHPVVAPRWTFSVWLWKGRALAAAGRSDEARRCFEKALDFAENGLEDYLPSRLLWSYDAMADAGMLGSRERALLELYPLNELEVEGRTLFKTGPEGACIRVRLAADEYFVDGQCQHTIPLHIRLAAGLALAGDLGMTRELAKCWLWPEDLASFFLLDRRLTQLECRLRKEFGFELQREREALWLTPRDRQRIFVDADPSSLPEFLNSPKARSDAGFTPGEVSESYQQSSRMVSVILHSWVERGWVKRTGAGRGIRYRLKSEFSTPIRSPESE